jgi:hypothetical protein
MEQRSLLSPKWSSGAKSAIASQTKVQISISLLGKPEAVRNSFTTAPENLRHHF